MSAKINKENNPDWLDKVMAKAVKLTEIEAAAGFPAAAYFLSVIILKRLRQTL